MEERGIQVRGPGYTPVSLLKKTFKPGERSLSRQEVAHRLLDFINHEGMAPEEIIDRALACQSSPFREGNSRAIIEYVQESHPLLNHVYLILKESGTPLNEEKILRKLRNLNLVSWSFPFERLGLPADPRFAQLADDDRWMLSEWELANDKVYDFLLQQGTLAVPMREIPYLIQMQLGMPKHKFLFIPEVDERFKSERDVLYIALEPQEAEAGRGRAGTENIQSIEEVAVAVSSETLEMTKLEGRSVVDEVVEDLMGALIKLEKRSGEMKEEVLGYFTNNNIEAIGSLMKEKEKNELVLGRIKEIVEELS